MKWEIRNRGVVINGFLIKDTHRGKPPSNETPALTKSRNIHIWVVGTSSQLFMRSS